MPAAGIIEDLELPGDVVLGSLGDGLRVFFPGGGRPAVAGGELVQPLLDRGPLFLFQLSGALLERLMSLFQPQLLFLQRSLLSL